MTTSLPKRWRKSNASSAQNTTASGSSPFTCSTGAPTILATSVQYSVERASSAALVVRSEEHTSELQSLMRISYAVFCLNKTKHTNTTLVLHLHIHRTPVQN